MESFLQTLLVNYLVVLKKYTIFSGRAGRREFWLFMLANFIMGIIFSILTKIPILKILFWVAYVLYSIAIVVPSIMVGIRRLHDTGKTGWLLLLCLIPVAGWVAVLVLCALEGTPGENQYGPETAENSVV
jgi:uncharacterized membrane protein YhaH (DUF805 family)